MSRTMLIAVVGLTSSISLAETPKEIKPISSDSPALVLVLPGIVGPGSEHQAIEEIKKARDTSGQKIGDAQIWNWTQALNISAMGIFSGNFHQLLYDNPETRRVAEQLALQLAEWKNRNPGKKVYLFAGSGGCLIASMACQQVGKEDKKPILGDGFFERVVFMSAALDPKQQLLKDLNRCTRDGIFNYYSVNDKIFAPLEYQAAGQHGYTSHHHDKQYVRAQLKWNESDSKEYCNAGLHLEGYETKYFNKFFIPLLTGNYDQSRWVP